MSGFHDAAEIHEICGVEFTRLRPAYHFVYLLLHIFRHLLGSWTRLLSLYEVATFIRKRKSEEDVWADAAQIIEKDKVLASACALVLGLVDCTFPIDMPAPLRQIGGEGFRRRVPCGLNAIRRRGCLPIPRGQTLSAGAEAVLGGLSPLAAVFETASSADSKTALAERRGYEVDEERAGLPRGRGMVQGKQGVVSRAFGL